MAPWCGPLCWPDATLLPSASIRITWGEPAALARLEAHNAAVRHVRCRIEKVFGTCKRSYGLRRILWLGLAKAGLQVRLAAIAYTLRRSLGLLNEQRA
ncbi:transposase [Roseomonas sp. OT10]|uniref:transposase n=1 Tax=Roseomonas cutis TaxID=2897332 RepID=UPI001E4ED705|nr:transposase [Roseomonas sp. OT10]UFN51501.1 transposase [Roseomonas sp. OT10]